MAEDAPHFQAPPALANAVADAMEVQKSLIAACSPVFQQVTAAFVSALTSGGRILLCGNGGSACDAQHVACELVGRFLRDRQPLPAMALNCDGAVMTSLSNDFGYEHLFERQVMALAKPGDVVVGISTSGNSPNVILAVEAAKAIGAVTIGFTGVTGGKLKSITDICFCAPSSHTPRIQEAHLLVWHAVCDAVEAEMCNRG